MGIFDKLREGLRKTNQVLNTDIRDLFKSRGRLVDDELLEELRAILIATDMGLPASQKIVDTLAREYRARVVEMGELLAVIKRRLIELLQQPETLIDYAPSGPTVILVAGVNGSGKTTSIAKLTRYFTSQNRRVVLGAGDTFRAAAVQQLGIWAERLGCELVRGEAKSDPASVAHRAVSRAVESGADICIVDTAGRLHTQTNLMKELTKIRSVIDKRLPGAPHESLLVIDATSGQNGIAQARHFSEAAGCTGIVLAKLDGTAKGGVVVSIREQVGIPVKFIGVGESADDLAVFDPQAFVAGLFAGFE